MMAEKAENNGVRENVPQAEANTSPDNTGNLDLLAH